MLNAHKMFNLVSNTKRNPPDLVDIVPVEKNDMFFLLQISLCVCLDNCLTFKQHVDNLVSKLERLEVAFFFRHKSCFSLEARRRLVASTFLSVLDNNNILFLYEVIWLDGFNVMKCNDIFMFGYFFEVIMFCIVLSLFSWMIGTL